MKDYEKMWSYYKKWVEGSINYHQAILAGMEGRKSNQTEVLENVLATYQIHLDMLNKCEGSSL